MNRRHTLTRSALLVGALTLLGCSTSHTGDCAGPRPDCVTEVSPGCCDTASIDAVCMGSWSCPGGTRPRAECAGVVGTDCMAPVPVPGPGGELGVCCPVTDFAGCSPGGTPLPAGGWARSYAACDATISGFDGSPFVHSRDAWGCETVIESSTGCCGCLPPPVDGGSPDAELPIACELLGPVACVAQPGCAPVWDDACCPSCTDGPCADCTNWSIFACAPRAEACGPGRCGATPEALCAGGVVDCSSALRVDQDSCDVPGCVPATAPIGGIPVDVECVPITADSCTVACRRVAPDCAAGTTPEGDGFCYTDRCIPAFVCE